MACGYLVGMVVAGCIAVAVSAPVAAVGGQVVAVASFVGVAAGDK